MPEPRGRAPEFVAYIANVQGGAKMPKAKGRRPDFVALIPIEIDRRRTTWVRAGAAWLTMDDEGGIETISINLNALPVSGRLVLKKPLEAPQEGEPA